MTAPVTTQAALAGLKVLDVAGTIASGYCGKLFADHGAQVVNVEPPDGGFATRREPPFIAAAAPPEDSALHAYLNTNKASVALDVDAEPTGLQALAADAAVVLDDGRFDTGTFAAAAPTWSSPPLRGSGAAARYAAFHGTHGVCWALAGMIRNVGPAEGPPLVASGCAAEIVGGLTAFIGTLGQVLAREMGNCSGPVRLDTASSRPISVSLSRAALAATAVVGAVGAWA